MRTCCGPILPKNLCKTKQILVSIGKYTHKWHVLLVVVDRSVVFDSTLFSLCDNANLRGSEHCLQTTFNQ